MRLKKVVAPVLALTLILGMSSPALAAEKHTFADVPAWADAAVTYSYDKGYVNGTSATTYNSDGDISVVEFVKVMVQMCSTPEQRTAIMDKAGTTPEQAADWTYQYRTIGKGVGLYAGIEQYADDTGATKCTRAMMAHILVNALKARGEDISTIDTNSYVQKLNDSAEIKGSAYVSDIGAVVGVGLITGDNNRNFSPNALMNRASAAQVFIRLDNPNGERQAALDKINEKSTTPTTPPVADATAPITIDNRTPLVAHRPPQEGDTVIRTDGTKVVLVRDKLTGVLGFGQGVAPYRGSTRNGADWVVGENEFGESSLMGFSDPLASGRYLSCKAAGYEGELHWGEEWRAIQKATSPIRAGIKGTEGQVDSTGLWKCDSEGWLWQGPDF